MQHDQSLLKLLGSTSLSLDKMAFKSSGEESFFTNEQELQGYQKRIQGYEERFSKHAHQKIQQGGEGAILLRFRIFAQQQKIQGRRFHRRENDLFLDNLFDDWRYILDNSFISDFIRNAPKFPLLSNSRVPTEGCGRCRIMLFIGCGVSFSTLRTAKEGCELCRLICSTAKQFNDQLENVFVRRVGSALTMEPGGRRILRLCADLEPSEGSGDEIQMSFPVLPAARSPLRFELFRKWLRLCEQQHNCKGSTKRTLPSRLLYVGGQHYPGSLRLVSGQETKAAEYIALSHCWGKLGPNEVLSYCTTRENIAHREEGFDIADLPLTFQDAVKVARELDVQYLWIDSLCIIQGKGGDWKQESTRMAAVYSSAYCTLAATSAIDSKSGFLDKRVISSDYVCIQDKRGRRVNVCANVADFDRDVEEAPLNSRGWVMQERLLSRRTIHFSANQTYWECGEGVYCEDLTRMTSCEDKTRYFKRDPEFPRLLHLSGFITTLHFLQSFLEDYSKRGLSKPTDRAVALSGLAARVEATLICKERYGIFDLYLCRNLLWQRSDLQKKRIDYEATQVPSWSWMAYEGGIQFIPLTDLPYGELDVFEDLQFAKGVKGALITKVWVFKGCHLNREASSETARQHIMDSSGTKRGWVMYDVEDGKDFCQERCVVVGRSRLSRTSNSRDYHILVVRQRGREGNKYERVGIGSIQQGYVLRQEPDVYIL